MKFNSPYESFSMSINWSLWFLIAVNKESCSCQCRLDRNCATILEAKILPGGQQGVIPLSMTSWQKLCDNIGGYDSSWQSTKGHAAFKVDRNCVVIMQAKILPGSQHMVMPHSMLSWQEFCGNIGGCDSYLQSPHGSGAINGILTGIVSPYSRLSQFTITSLTAARREPCLPHERGSDSWTCLSMLRSYWQCSVNMGSSILSLYEWCESHSYFLAHYIYVWPTDLSVIAFHSRCSVVY